MPTVQLRGIGSADGVPRELPDHGAGAPPPMQQTQPQAHALPQAYGPPPMPAAPPAPPAGPMPLVAPPTPPPGSMATAHLPPHLVQYGVGPSAPDANTVVPGQPYPYPYGAPPMSFTKQLQAAIEVDDIPQRYKFQENRSRRVVWAVVLVLLFAGGIGLAVLLTRQSQERPSAALVIESTPPGAQVTVDGVRLADPTPVRYPTSPGERHEIEVSAPRHKTWKQAVVVPSTGGDIRVPAMLGQSRVKLQINSQPGGAEIYIQGEFRGVTPKVIEDLDPATTKEVELRHRDFAPEKRPLEWGDRETLGVDVKFVRK